MRKSTIWLPVILILTIFVSCNVFQSNKNSDVNQNWPTYLADNCASGISSQNLEYPLLKKWVYQPGHAPTPAWPAPASQDFWHRKPKLSPLVTYDRVSHVSVAAGGVFFASSSENKVSRLNAVTGEIIWNFFTAAPDRIAPVYNNNRIYFGSDDGYFYCLNAANGRLLWKYLAGEQNRKIMGNGRLISECPVRTGCIVQGDIVYFAAGIFPNQEVYVIALNAETGAVIWKEKQTKIAPQGYPILTDSTFYLPNSRSRPAGFNLKTGVLEQKFSGGSGGDYLHVADQKLIYGVGDPGKSSEDVSADIKEDSFSGYRIISDSTYEFIASDNQITAIVKETHKTVLQQQGILKEKLEDATTYLALLRREAKNDNKLPPGEMDAALEAVADLGRSLEELQGKEIIWTEEVSRPYTMIKCGRAIITGEENIVNAFSISSGQKIWSCDVQGRVYGLAAADGRLLISTDTGNIYCFSPDSSNAAVIVTEKKETYSPAGYYNVAVDKIFKEFDRKRGVCLVLDCRTGDLPMSLAARSELTIICQCKNETAAAALRQRFFKAGFSGKRIAVYSGDLAEINLSSYLVNLIVSEGFLLSGRFTESFEDLWAVLRPEGGKLIMSHNGSSVAMIKSSFTTWIGEDKPADMSFVIKEKWAVIGRGRLPGSGEWTHLYADAQNRAASGDSLVYDYLVPQWFGKPGPRDMADRHHRAPSPLYKNGLIHIPGFGRLITADAYNGTLLWEKKLPEFKRLGIFRDAGNMAVTDELLYVALNLKACGFDPLTGELKEEFSLPQLQTDQRHYWGYLAVSDSLLLGSARKPKAGYNTMSWKDDNELWKDYKPSVTSDYLFSFNRITGRPIWSYQAGIIVNPTITIGGDCLYFLESKAKAALADRDGLIDLQTILGDSAAIVCLDINTGKRNWKVNVNFSTKRHHIFFSYTQNLLFSVSSRNHNNTVYYDIHAFDATTGKLIWQQEQNNEKRTKGGHGEQHLHPAIVGDKVYAEPYCYDIFTGKLEKDWKLVRNGHGCGTISASENSLYFRARNPALCNLYEDETTQWVNSVNRPGCWINMIPAGGLLIMPEASSGCTCDFPLQTSLAYLPLSRDLDVLIQVSEFFSNGSRTITMHTRNGSGQIFYTVDGSLPNNTSQPYIKPFEVTTSLKIRAIAENETRQGRVAELKVPVYVGLYKPVKLSTAFNPRYSGGGSKALTDGKRGSINQRDPAWQAYKQVNLEAVIDMGRNVTSKSITISCLEKQKSWIFLPKEINIFISEDGYTYQNAGHQVNRVTATKRGAVLKEFHFDLNNITSRFIRIQLINVGDLPEWHPSGGSNAWLFVDEIVVE